MVSKEDITTPPFVSPDLRSVTPLLRPPRLAVGVPSETSLDDWQALLHAANARWGGARGTAFFPAAHWSPGNEWDRLLSRFDPDYICIVGGAIVDRDRIVKRLAPLRFVQSPRMVPPGVVSFQGSALVKDVIGLTPPSHAARSVALNGVIQAWPYPAPALPPPLRLLRTRSLAELSASDRAELQASGRVHFGPTGTGDTPDEQVYHALDEAMSENLSAPMMGLNLWGLDVLAVVESRTSDIPVIIVGDSVDAIACWLTLSSLLPAGTVFWLPELDADGSDLATLYGSMLVSAVDAYVQVNACARVDVINFGTGVQMRASRAASWHDMAPGDLSPGIYPRCFLSLTRGEGMERQEFTDGVSHQFVRWTWPDWLRTAGTRIRFLGELDVERTPLVTHPAVQPLTDPVRPARAGRYGVVLDPFKLLMYSVDDLNHALTRTTLVLPSIEESLRRIGTADGLVVGVSDAGRRMHRLLERFASAAHAYRALTEGSWSRLSARITDDDPESRDVVQLSVGRRAMTVDRMRTLLVTWHPEADPDVSLDAWSKNRFLRWGMVAKCDSCFATEFYDWALLQHDTVACWRCRTLVGLRPARSPRWGIWATLDEIVLQLTKSHGIDELALGLVLDANCQVTSSFGTTFTTVSDGRPQHSVEVDVCSVQAGELVLGEAKSAASLGRKHGQPGSLLNLAERLDARRVVFATSAAAWLPATLARFDALRPRYSAALDVYANIRDTAGGIVADLLGG